MASVDTLSPATKSFSDTSSARTQQELLQAGRLKLEQYKQKRKSKKSNAPRSKNANGSVPTHPIEDEQSWQLADAWPSMALDASPNITLSQNGGDVPSAKREVGQDGGQGTEHSEHMPLASDASVSTADSDMLLSEPLDPYKPFSAVRKAEAISPPVESARPSVQLVKEQQPIAAVKIDVDSGTACEMVTSNLDGGSPWRNNPISLSARSAHVSDVSDSEPPVLESASNAEIEISKKDGYKSAPLKDWSTLNFSKPSSTPPVENFTSTHAPLSQPSVSKPLFPSSSPFMPRTTYKTGAESDPNKYSFPTTTSPSPYLSESKSRTSTSLPFSSIPLRPLSFSSPEQEPPQPATNSTPPLENNYFRVSTEHRPKPPNVTSSPVLEGSLFAKPILPSRPPFESFNKLQSNSFSAAPPISQPSLFTVGGYKDTAGSKIYENGHSLSQNLSAPVSTLLFSKPDTTAEDSRKEREEFASLEQHIQDLTEEKFAFQRSLDKSKTMTENLAAENSALMEDFNNQGVVVNQLRDDLEILEARIREQEAVAKSLMLERDKAQQESAASVERSQTMAGEVIVLENRVRTLRSHELRLERDMTSLTSEVESHKRQFTSWEKDRAHLRTMVEALQEEKKVLQVRLRKAANVEQDISQTREIPLVTQILTDASTSTDDLPVEPLTSASEGPSTPLDSPSLDSWQHGRQFEYQSSGQNIVPSMLPRLTDHSSQFPLSASTLSGERFPHLLSSDSGPSSSGVRIGSPQSGGYRTIHLPALSSSIPADLVTTINNINDVITSLGEEKTALVKALKAESRGAAELRALNSDLSQKLETTTQRLELIVAQRMAPAQGNRSAEEVTPRVAPVALDYVDEGDEVVDRVFTWIMQLFPGGNSRRNGMKRL